MSQNCFAAMEYEIPNSANPDFKAIINTMKDNSKMPFDLNNTQILGTIDALEYWSQVLKDNKNAAVFTIGSMNEENAGAMSPNVVTYDEYGNEVIMTMVEADFLGIKWDEFINENGERQDKSEYNLTAGLIQIGTINFNDYTGEKKPLLKESNADIRSVLSHEVLHALGVSSDASYEDTGEGVFNELNLWESHLKIYDRQADVEISAQNGTEIWTKDDINPPASGLIFNIGKYNPYFVGDNVIKVLGGSEDYETALNNIKNNETKIPIRDASLQPTGEYYKGLVHYQYNTNSNLTSAVWGLPINGVEDGVGDLSHIELRNCLMSHQNYRNWLTFMEAELAVLEDIGYETNISNFFGKSYYLNNISAHNSKEFFTSRDFGVGLHIYGDNNTIVQDANIGSSAAAAIGARIDGVNNSLTISNGTSIEMDGKNNLGVAVTYGSRHKITIEKDAKVSAADKTGIGASFDFGKNLLGETSEHRGSFILNKFEEDFDVNDIAPELCDPLVEKFDVKGELSGGKAAIYISDNAFVKEINVYSDAKILGNILSEWNSKTSGNINAAVQKTDLYTCLNFGQATDPVSSTINFYDNITGPDTLALNINGGKLKISDGTGNYKGQAENINVRDINISNNAALINSSENTTYTVTNKFNNSGEFNIDQNSIANIKTANFNNENLILIKGIMNLNSAEIDGTGTIDIKYKGILNVNSGSDTLINNTVKMESSSLSTINNNNELTGIKDLNLVDINSSISFDLGDTFKIDNLSGKDTIMLSQIATSKKNLDSLSENDEIFIFDSDKVLTLDKEGHAYLINTKYTFTQGTDGKKDRLIVSKEVGNFRLNNAASDSTTASYFVSNNEKMTNTDAVKINGESFLLEGGNVNFNGRKGLKISEENKITTIKTSILNSEGAAIYTEGSGNSSVIVLDSSDKSLTISSDNSSNVILLGGNSNLKINAGNDINVLGYIKGTSSNLNEIQIRGINASFGGFENININQNADNVIFNNKISNSVISLNNGNATVTSDIFISGGTNTLNINGGSLNLANNQASKIKLSELNINANSNLRIDIDISAKASDTFVFDDPAKITTTGDKIKIDNVNIVNTKTGLTESIYKIPFTADEFNNMPLAGNITVSDNIKREILTPIFKYDLDYKTEDNLMPVSYFTLSRRGDGSSWHDFNSSILVSPVAALTGTYVTQLNSYEQAFYNKDMLMLMTANKKTALHHKNLYASTVAPMTFNQNQFPEKENGIWFRPYTTFEKIGLKNAPKVQNIAYGSYFGGDFGLIELKRDWNMVWSPYAAYTGSRQNYEHNNTTQNGGIFGLSAVLYKDNFFAGLTANAGAISVTADTMYGHDNFTMLTSGIAAKTGYNFALKNSKFLIQPSLLTSYTFVKTFNYTTAGNVKIDADSLNAFQLSPQIKLIGTIKNGWHPYAFVSMVWNLTGKTKFKANDVNLPEISIKPYVQYGAGVQKYFNNNFSISGETFIRNAGRSSIDLQLGFSWKIGKK